MFLSSCFVMQFLGTRKISSNFIEQFKVVSYSPLHTCFMVAISCFSLNPSSYVWVSYFDIYIIERTRIQPRETERCNSKKLDFLCSVVFPIKPGQWACNIKKRRTSCITSAPKFTLTFENFGSSLMVCLLNTDPDHVCIVILHGPDRY